MKLIELSGTKRGNVFKKLTNMKQVGRTGLS
jgi:hypothetical protein